MVKLCKNYDLPNQPATDARFRRRTPSQTRFENQNPSLRYKRARFYSAQLGRFISRDPIGYVDGMSLYRAYFVPRAVDPWGLLTKLGFHPPRQEEYHNDSDKVTKTYCDVAAKYPDNGWLECVCKMSGRIDWAITVLEAELTGEIFWWQFGGYDPDFTSLAKISWFKCMRTCMQKKWHDAIQEIEQNDAEDGPTKPWQDWCDKCSANSGSYKCCKLQVVAEQKGMTSCMSRCGKWKWGNTFPINYTPGWDDGHDFNNETHRISYGIVQCCPDNPNPPPVSPMIFY